ncbi:MAG TPA: thioredoxin [Polyangiaceae bacterium]|nr:thioredoxin [Polyangiaceae bacterium]
MSGKVPYVGESEFDAEVLKADKTVLVDFTASWCGPCKALAPVIEKVADEAAGKYKVVKVDVDEAPKLASRYGIRGVPTVMAFRGGEQVAQQVGLTNLETLRRMAAS